MEEERRDIRGRISYVQLLESTRGMFTVEDDHMGEFQNPARTNGTADTLYFLSSGSPNA